MLQPPVPQKIDNVLLPKPEEITLDNGIPLFVINAGSQEVNKIECITEGGTCDTPTQIVAQAYAALGREGTAHYSAKELEEKLDFYGAWLTSGNTNDCMSLPMFSINRHFEKVLPYYHDIFEYPTYPEDKLEILKERTLSNLHLKRNEVAYLCNVEFNKQFFGKKHPLGITTDEEAIKNIKREMLSDFHNEWCAPENTAIIASGLISDKSISLINKHFGQTQRKGAPKQSKSDAPTDFAPSTSVLHKEDAVQSAIMIGIPTIPRVHPDYIPLRILVTAFGGYFGSRLMQNIREEKGYTYGISSHLIGMRNTSCIKINCQCDNKYTYKVIDEINAEIAKLKAEPIPADELENVRFSMLEDLLKTTDTPFSISEYYASKITSHIPDNYFADQCKTIQTITPEELMHIARKYFTNDRITTIVGNKDKL